MALSLSILLAFAGAASAADPGQATKQFTAPDPAEDAGCVAAVKALRARYDVRDVDCQPSWYKTSHPPKLLLTYTLEGRVYREYVSAPSVRTAENRRKPAPDEAPRRKATTE